MLQVEELIPLTHQTAKGLIELFELFRSLSARLEKLERLAIEHDQFADRVIARVKAAKAKARRDQPSPDLRLVK